MPTNAVYGGVMHSGWSLTCHPENQKHEMACFAPEGPCIMQYGWIIFNTVSFRIHILLSKLHFGKSQSSIKI